MAKRLSWMEERLELVTKDEHAQKREIKDELMGSLRRCKEVKLVFSLFHWI